MMRISASKVVQICYRRRDGEPVEVYPRFNFDDSAVSSTVARYFVDGVPLREQLRRKPDSKICFLRSYNLGDVLLLTPVINSIKDQYPDSKMVLATGSSYLNLFKYWDRVTVLDKRWVMNENYDMGYYLNDIVEKDHLGNEWSYYHRTDLYCKFLGFDIPKDPVFSLPYSDKEKAWAGGVINGLREDGKPVVIFQFVATAKNRSLSVDKLMKVCQHLIRDCSLIFVHSSPENIGMSGTLDMCGKTTIHQLAALVDASDVVVTVDSATLWLAHCTRTPVVALLGTTREKEKLCYHRNYVSIDLAKLVDCEPCFGSMRRCGGAGKCMTAFDSKVVGERILDGVKRLFCS